MKTKQSKLNSQNPAAKGYLPVPILLPPTDDRNKHSYTSVVYIKEHAQKSGGTPASVATLFVANAPANGPISTDVFLRALFELYGDIRRVTVAKDPRKIGLSSPSGEEAARTFRDAALTATDNFAADTARHNRSGDGKYAHVVFTSGKEMKKALKILKRKISEAGGLFAIRLGKDKLEQLKVETARLLVNNDGKGSDDELRNKYEEETEPLTGIHAVATRARRKAGRHIPRHKLMQMCNEAMATFENEEAETERKAKLAAEQPDEEGFITVTHKSAQSFGAANDLEDDLCHTRRKGGKRNRKRKAGSSGADELTDFYHFQLRETRKREVHDLKKRFEEDLEKVKTMKEKRAYRPF